MPESYGKEKYNGIGRSSSFKPDHIFRLLPMGERKMNTKLAQMDALARRELVKMLRTEHDNYMALSLPRRQANQVAILGLTEENQVSKMLAQHTTAGLLSWFSNSFHVSWIIRKIRGLPK